jgi:hypothetical protein
MSKITCYNDLLDKIKDERLKNTFIEMTEEYDKNNLNTQALDIINIFVNVSYEKIKEEYLKIVLLSEPEFWIFYIYDKDFLSYIKDSWEDFKILLNSYKEEEIKEELDIEEFKNIKKNIKKLKLITNLLQEMYPEIFN